MDKKYKQPVHRKGKRVSHEQMKRCATSLVKRENSPGWVAQLLEHHPIHQNVCGLISSQGTYLDCRFNPQSGQVQEAIK